MITEAQKRALFIIAYRNLYSQLNRPKKGSKAKIFIVFPYPQERCFQKLVSEGLADCRLEPIKGYTTDLFSRVWTLTSKGKKIAREYAKKLIAEKRAKIKALTA